jgi:hypothetical protein
MIRMIVRDEHTHDILEIQPHITQILLNLARRDAGVNQYSPMTRAQIVTVTATTACKTTKYEPVFVHTIKKSCKGTKKIAYMQIILADFKKKLYLCAAK